MRTLSGPIWDLWNAGGPFVGRDKPNGYVTVEFGWVLRESTGAVGDRPAAKLPIRWWQRADNSQTETILPNVKNVSISRSIDQDAATLRMDVYNTQMIPQGIAELGNPGYFTFGRGSHPDAATRWGHTPNEWSAELTPNALLRTYEGYGGWNDDGTQMPLEDALAAGYVVQTGAWLVDEWRPETDAMLHVTGRDAAKLLIDQPIFPPLVPAGLYPLQYARFYYRHVSTPYIAYGHAANDVKFIVGIVADADNDGYWLVGDDGGVFTYGNTFFYGSLSGDVSHGVIGMARSYGHEGYWLATVAGEVFAFGDAPWHGGNPPAVGEDMIAVESIENGDGYYLCDTAGHVYSFGTAIYHGGGPGTSPIAAMAVMPDGTGYSLMDDTGHVYTYGAASYYGGGDPTVGSLYTSIESTPTGHGYWLTTEKGHVYALGDAVYFGGTSAIVLNDPISDITRRPDGAGYWLTAQDGGVFTFGAINFYGSLPGATENDYPLDGNYFDYADIIKDLLLWSGFWLYDGGVSPDVYGNIESTGAYNTAGFLPIDMFDKKPPMEAITAIREVVGYITWVDADGAFHFESPNWWNEGNWLPDGSRTNVLPEIDERVQLINYGVSLSDKDARDRIIITNVDPAANMILSDTGEPMPGAAPEGAQTTTVVSVTAAALRGLLKPVMWANYMLSSPDDQQVMATLLGNQLMFRQRIGSVVAWANPLFEVNDQCRIWERQTDEVYDHYLRGIDTDHDFDSGQYTMRLTTHWLGRDWAGPGPNRNVHIGGVRTGEAFGLVGFDVPGDVFALGVPSAAAVGNPTVLTGGIGLMAGLSSSFAAGIPTVVGPQTIEAAGVSSGENVGRPTVAQTEHIGGVASGEAAGQPTVTPTISPQAATSSESTGNPTVVWAQTILSGSVSSGAGFGQPVVSNVATPLAFEFLGFVQKYTVPNGVTSLAVDVSGAEGGGLGTLGSPRTNGTDHIGGRGGRVTGTLPVSRGQVLYVYVGGAGTVNNNGVAGGWNGGGNGNYSGSGGGASDIRSTAGDPNTRLVTAGGGGGQTPGVGGFGANDRTGAGGGTTGGAGSGLGGIGGGGGGTPTGGGAGGTGGTANGAAGGFSTGGNGGQTGWSNGGGGGGGWYGGGGGAGTGGNGDGGAGGGGSSQTDASVTGVVHEQGVRAGDGRILITPNGGPSALLFLDDFADLTTWSTGGFSLSPAGWAYDGSTALMTHRLEAGAAYVEALLYGDATTGDNWIPIKFGVPSGGNPYDANGASILIRSTNGSVEWGLTPSATVSWTDPSWTGSIPTPPRSAATAVLVGLHKTAPGTYDLYINRQKVQTVTGVTGDGGAYLGIGAYNNIGGHIDYVAIASALLTSDPR
jgi:hypothetical protein